MIDVDLAFPLSAGVVAAFNPCGFAMLPAYLAYFLGTEASEDRSQAASAARGLAVGLTLSAGFVFLFGLVGFLTGSLLAEGFIERRLGYATFTFGVLMVPLGVAMVLGFEPKLRLPRMNRGTGGRGLGSVFAFGVSYAVVSISCTAPIFFGAVVGSFSRVGFVNGLATFIAYAVGMSLVVMTLTIGIAMARTSVSQNMRRVLPFVNRAAGSILAVAGVFLATYGLWEIRIQRNPAAGGSPLVDLSNSASARLNQWVADVGGVRFAVATLVIFVGVLIWALSSSLYRRGDRRAVRAAFVAIYGTLEVVRYEYDLLALPVIRTLLDVPERVGHWFAEPLRWPVLFEVVAGILVTALVVVMGLRFARGSRARRKQLEAGPLQSVNRAH